MLKLIIGCAVLASALFLIASPIIASDTYSVGSTSWDVNGIKGSSITITVNPPSQDFPPMTAEELAKAETTLAVGNKLYQAESLRGKTVLMTVYMKEAFSEFPNFVPSTVCVKNLYQGNQEIISYQSP